MKELTIEGKARAYDEAIKRAKEWEGNPAAIDYIFPELADSEDEKIRKMMIRYFESCGNLEWYDGLTPQKAVAWLEKQGEQILANSAKTCKDKQNHAWSEEDNQMIKNVQSDYHNRLGAGIIPQAYHDKVISWLKSLKGRVQQQPKQEWSEEDEEILRTILSDGIRGAELDMLQVNWLKSLRPQSRWKPSEDDIIILEKLINGELEPKVFQATLHGILEQLKKL